MSTVEFVLWLAGAVDLVGEEPPTPAQWAQIREKATEVVGAIAASKILERAAELEKSDAAVRAEQASYLGVQKLSYVQEKYLQQVQQASAQVKIYAENMAGLANATPSPSLAQRLKNAAGFAK